MKEFVKPPLISVVVPVYNGDRYIDGLFARFLDQAAGALELVFVDDGSTDHTYQKLLQWQKQAPFPVTVLHQENQGVSGARNAGVSAAGGRYIAFADVDDAFAPNYVSSLTEYALQGPDVLIFDSRRVKAGGEEMSRPAEAQPPEKPTKQDMLMEFLADPTRFGVYNLLLRKEYLSARSIQFTVGYPYYEDYDYLLQVFAQADELVRVRQVLYYYVLREESAMARFTAERINCLSLMKERGQWLWHAAPEFAPVFQKWGTARLYWSVLWQAALAFSTYAEFSEFAELTHARSYLRKLKGYPDPLLQLSTQVFLISRPLYRAAVRMAGRAKSKVLPAALEDIRQGLRERVDFF